MLLFLIMKNLFLLRELLDARNNYYNILDGEKKTNKTIRIDRKFKNSH